MERKKWANVILCLIIFFIFGYAVTRVSEAPDIVTLLNPERHVSPAADSYADLVKLEDYHFEINQVTKKVKAEFLLDNESHDPVYEVVISCELQDRTGAHRGSGEWVIYDTIDPESSERYIVEDKRYISHMVTPDSIACRIVDLKTSGIVVAANDHNGH